MDEIPVVAAVIRRGGRVLLGRRPEHKRHGGLWEFPGGKVHEGETDFQAVERELAEELELRTVSVGSVLFENADPESPFLIRFVEVEVDGDPTALEHAEIGWFDPGALQDLPLAPSDARFIVQHLLGALVFRCRSSRATKQGSGRRGIKAARGGSSSRQPHPRILASQRAWTFGIS